MAAKGHSYLDLTALPEIGSLLLAPQPAWLWSIETGNVLWANAAAAAHSGVESIEALLNEAGGDPLPADFAAVAASLGEELPQMRRIPLPSDREPASTWCLCTKLMLADGVAALLAVSTDGGVVAEPMAVHAGRLVQSLAGNDIVAALVRPDGRILAASDGFTGLPGSVEIIADLTAQLGTQRLRKRKETFGGERRLAGIASVGTPDDSLALIIIGPAEPVAAAEVLGKDDGAAHQPTTAGEGEAPEPDDDTTPHTAPPLTEASGKGRRFTFSLGPDLTFTAVSPELTAVVGAANADIVNQSWDDVSDQLDFDSDRTIAIALARRDTWSGVTVHWPVEDGGTVAINLTAIPSFRNGSAFEGFRGFGVIRSVEASAKASGIAKVETAPAEQADPADAKPSNVVRLPSADRVDAKRAGLSGDEQDAFRRIAEALRAVERKPSAADSAGVDASDRPPAPRFETPPGKVPLRLLDRLPIGIVVFRSKTVMFANRSFLDRLGYPNIEALANAGGVDALFDELPAPDSEDTGTAYRVPLVTADRIRVQAEARLHLVPWEDGPATMLSVRDLPPPQAHDEGKAGESGRSRVKELEAILDTATDGTLVLDEQGRILDLNKSAEALFGIDTSEVVGKSFTDLLADESRRPANDYLEGIARNGVASVLNDGREVIGRVPNGGLIPLFMTMGRLAERDKFCVVLRDITQWKNAEEELVNARRTAEIASKQKSDFLAKISHEIRTPLNAIIGFSDVILEERFGPIGVDRYREYLKDIRLSGSHLMSLINDLLDLSKIESGHLDLTFGAVSLNQILRECVALMQPEANRQRIIIRTSLAEDVPQVVADERSLRQIALNLLSNAVKFNVAGGQVIVSTALDQGEVVIRIRDTGIGMSHEEIDTALQPFQQIATTGPARFEGTGLGLPLTKALVEANRASFEIESEPRKGTLVRIAFPIERVLQP